MRPLRVDGWVARAIDQYFAPRPSS